MALASTDVGESSGSIGVGYAVGARVGYAVGACEGARVGIGVGAVVAGRQRISRPVCFIVVPEKEFQAVTGTISGFIAVLRAAYMNGAEPTFRPMTHMW